MSSTEEPTPAEESTPAPEPEEEPTGEPLPQAAEENLIPESTFDPATGQQLPVKVADQPEEEGEDEAEEAEEEDADE